MISNNVKCNQQQFDALVCFTYNVGAYALDNDSDLSDTLLNTAYQPALKPSAKCSKAMNGDG